MSNEPEAADGWVKFSERSPEPTRDFPCWFYSASALAGNPVFVAYDGQPWKLLTAATHWKKVIVPEPPKTEPTQEELDRDAYSAWRDEDQGAVPPPSVAWHAALAWERAQVRAMMQPFTQPADMPASLMLDFLERLAKRVGFDLKLPKLD